MGLFSRTDHKAKAEMSAEDKQVIIDFAQGSEQLREAAIAAHRRNIPIVGVRGNDCQRFMAEIDNPSPDYALRAAYRVIVCLGNA